VLFWTVLVVVCVAFLGWRTWLVWGKTKALGREVQRASELVAQLESRADELRDLDPAPIAATQPIHRLRAEHREQRASAKAARHLRRADRLPPWARVH
jgi:cell division protein FtsX